MYIMITEIVGEKRINPAYPIRGKEVTIVSMFTNNVQCQIRDPLKVLLITNGEKQLPKRMFMDRELNVSVGRKLISTPLDVNDNIIKMFKLACIMEVALSLDKLDNTDNLEDGRLSNILQGIM